MGSPPEPRSSARRRVRWPGEYRSGRGGDGRGVPAIIRHRPRTRGVAAQHASLSRWRSPVRIRSGPPPFFASSRAPSARPDGAPLFPGGPIERGLYAAAVSVRRPTDRPSAAPAAGRRPSHATQPPGLAALCRHRAHGRRRPPHRCRRSSRGRSGAGRPRRRAGSPRGRPRQPDRRRTPKGPPSPSDVGSGRIALAIGLGRAIALVVTDLVDADVAIVPVTNFRSPRSRRSSPSTSGRWSPAGHAFDHVVLVEADADAVLEALKLPREALGDKLVTVATPAAVAKRLSNKRRDIGFLRAGDVGPSVRALGWGEELAVRRGPRRLARRLAAAGDAPRRERRTAGLRPGPRLDDGRGRRHPARPRREARHRRPRGGHRLPVQRRAQPRSPAPARTARRSAGTPRTRSAPATPARSAALTKGADIAIANFENPAPERLALPPVGHRLLGQPRQHRRASRTRASTGCRWPTTTSATPVTTGSSRR